MDIASVPKLTPPIQAFRSVVLLRSTGFVRQSIQLPDPFFQRRILFYPESKPEIHFFQRFFRFYLKGLVRSSHVNTAICCEWDEMIGIDQSPGGQIDDRVCDFIPKRVGFLGFHHFFQCGIGCRIAVVKQYLIIQIFLIQPPGFITGTNLDRDIGSHLRMYHRIKDIYP